ncbi:alpha-amylase/4-alpha-glucanotransferase domain-containing protein [Sulfurimonas sp. HSL-1716]|uniref:alpha-amylase/4-alpha-glucanotransferase domain-containing protein n=1 Tax=Hydrocurvibacter sulfurireducens TaxID=3131937 RepID=UPI0031FA0EF2
MKRVSLLFGIHMHQPVDNFSDSVESAVNLCYRPFFETMAKYPEFKFAVHCSGWLLERIRTKNPDIFENMRYLTKQGSIEWLSAGYYEPVLSAIPSPDRIAQIKKLNRYIKKYFKVSPRGLWLTERVWESALVPDLAECGIDYAVVDDYHFLSSGFEASQMNGYYTTEESAKEIGLFPISKALRYALPFYDVQNAIASVLSSASDEDSAAVVFDDAEKFGLWPKTHTWVYEKHWLKEFVEAVLADDRILSQHYGTYMKKNRSLGIAYLNNTSYFEMGEWSLKSTQAQALEELKQSVGEHYFNDVGISFIKGGIWKNFFIKYKESNYLHKRMLYFSKQREALGKNALESLYKLQTNDVYWHGIFGGIYLPNLRDNAYRYLLELERSCAKKEVSIELLDIDKDGYDELKVVTKNLSMVFSSKFGGQMMEFGALDVLFNWQNTLMRQKEIYHEKLLRLKESGESLDEDTGIDTIHSEKALTDDKLKAELIYDWHPKYSFIDHFCRDELTLESFKNMAFTDIADFANRPFSFHKNKNSFSRTGGIYLDWCYETNLKKEYRFKDNSFSLDLKCSSEYKEKLFYAQEFNLHFAHPHRVTFNGKTLQKGLKEYNCDELVMVDDFTKKVLRLKIDRKCNIFGYILNTVSKSEKGFDKTAQEVSFVLTLPFSSKLNLKVELELSDV